MGGLALIALTVVALVLALGVPFWIGLIVLAIADAALLFWAYVRLILKRQA
tara:strand:- start:251 stop:403 length:153 start_codon:yes stop_codon:yes gene_type:complete